MKNNVETDNNQNIKHRKKKGGSISFFLVVVLLIVGIVYENIEERKFVDSRVMLEEICDLGTYKCAFTLTEIDNPQREDLAFVFIAGSGTPSTYTDFYALREYFSKYGDCLSFDRSGFGYSSNTTIERSLTNLVYELEVLINKEVPDKKIVLVAHSMGSIEAIGYAQKHSDIVEAIVFLDSGSPEYYSTSNEYLAKFVNVSTTALRFCGINRALGKIGLILPLYGEKSRYHGLPDTFKEFDLESYYYETGNSATWDYVDKMNENASLLLEGGKLNNLPILCISSNGGKAWSEAQTELSNLSTNSTLVSFADGGHYVHWSNQEETIQNMISFLINNEIISK